MLPPSWKNRALDGIYVLHQIRTGEPVPDTFAAAVAFNDVERTVQLARENGFPDFAAFLEERLNEGRAALAQQNELYQQRVREKMAELKKM